MAVNETADEHGWTQICTTKPKILPKLARIFLCVPLGAHASCVPGFRHAEHAGSVRSQGKRFLVLGVSAVNVFGWASLLCVHPCSPVVPNPLPLELLGYMVQPKKAVVLVSGGIDSSTVLALASKQGYETHALSFDYGQRHRHELDAAHRVVTALGAASHVVVRIDLRAFGGSALTADIDVPKRRKVEEMAAEIPITYVPARNTIFLSLALGWCEVLGADDVFVGVNAIDFSGYPDCRPAFLEAFERLANLATRAGVEGRANYRIHAPLIQMTKAEIIRAGHEAGVDFSLTHSCYDPAPGGLACGACDSCILRRKGFQEAGLPDPTRYAHG